MSPEDQILLAIRDEIAKMSPEIQAGVREAVNDVKAAIKAHGQNGLLALTLVGAELSALGEETPA
jgi:BMFP domain-containing protein YqiC